MGTSATNFRKWLVKPWPIYPQPQWHWVSLSGSRQNQICVSSLSVAITKCLRLRVYKKKKKKVRPVKLTVLEFQCDYLSGSGEGLRLHHNMEVSTMVGVAARRGDFTARHIQRPSRAGQLCKNSWGGRSQWANHVPSDPTSEWPHRFSTPCSGDQA